MKKLSTISILLSVPSFSPPLKKPDTMRFQYIVNPSAGQSKYKRVIGDIRRALSGQTIDYDIIIPRHGEELASLTRKAAGNYDAVVAVGGDGTVNQVVNGIISTKLIFGIIPAGTGNGFARECGLPLRCEKACKVLIDGHTKWIDVGKVNASLWKRLERKGSRGLRPLDRYFVGTAGLGFDALIAGFAGKMLGHFRGMWVYFIAGAFAFYRYRRQLINIEIDSRTINAYPLLVAIANTRRYGGRALIAPDAVPDDGLFDVCIIQNMKGWRLLRHLPKLFSGKHTKLPEVAIYKGSKIAINAPEPVPVHVDGELIGSYTEIQFTLLPKALRILVPGD